MPGPSWEIPLLNPDFRDILSEFIAHEVEFLLVGAYAMAAHGYPKSTGDIDLFIHPTPKNADRVLEALVSFGAPLMDLTKEDLVTPGIVYQIGVAPRRVDILTHISGVSFAEAWESRIVVEIDELQIPVLSFYHLLQNKRATGRPKDQADLVWLESQKERNE